LQRVIKGGGAGYHLYKGFFLGKKTPQIHHILRGTKLKSSYLDHKIPANSEHYLLACCWIVQKYFQAKKIESQCFFFWGGEFLQPRYIARKKERKKNTLIADR
jgi:hypothetical protein